LAQPRLSFSTFFGGSGSEVVTASTTDEAGFVWVTGYTLSNDLPTSAVRFQETRPGIRDIFIARLDPRRFGSDALIYSTYLGGTGSEEPTSIVAQGGFVYVAGFTNSIDFPLAGNAFQASPSENQNGFVLKLDPTLGGTESLVYSTYLGGSGLDRVNAIAVRNGLIYAAGYTTSDNFPENGALGNASRGAGDAFAAILNPNASPASATLTFSTLLSGIAFDNATAVAVNTAGDMFVAGTTASGDFTASDRAYQFGFQGGTDVFLARINANRTRAYSTYLGGGLHDVPLALHVAGADVVTIAGYTLSTNFPTTDGAPQGAAKGNGDAFVARLNLDNAPPQQLTFATLLGGENGDVATAVTLGQNGTYYVTGYTLSSQFPVQGTDVQRENAGAVDAFLARVDPAGRSIQYSTMFGGGSVDNAVGVHELNACEVALAGQTQSRGLKVTETAFQSALNGLSDAFVTVVNFCP